MSNKQKISLDIISKDQGLSMIKQQASISGPGIILNESGKMSLDVAVSTDAISFEDVINNNNNKDIIETHNGYKVKQSKEKEIEKEKEKDFKSKMEKNINNKVSGQKLSKNKGIINQTKIK